MEDEVFYEKTKRGGAYANFRVNKHPCWRCGRENDTMTPIDGPGLKPGKPEKGSWIACIECGAPAVLDGSPGNWTARPPTSEERAEMRRVPTMRVTLAAVAMMGAVRKKDAN